MTQEDIAKLAGVSRTTVSRVLNGDPTVKIHSKNKVLEVIEKVGYEKNYISSTLASKREKIIYAFIVKSKTTYYSKEMRKGLENFQEEYRGFGLKIEIVEIDINSPEKQLALLEKTLKENEVNGVIITPLLKKEVLELISQYKNITFITLDTFLSPEIYHVGSNYFNSGQISADIAAGILRKFEKALVLKFPGDNVSVDEYYKGFISSLAEERLVISFETKDILKEKNFLTNKLSKNIKVIFTNRYVKEIIDINREFLEKKKEIKIIGISGNPEINKFLSSGFLYASVNDQYSLISYTAVNLMFNILYKNIKPDLLTLIPSIVLFKSSVY